MQNQIIYYNNFGTKFEQDILNCKEPEFWTTDIEIKGRVYNEIKLRVESQFAFITNKFEKSIPVLDIGCGFGRQSFLLAKHGYKITGIDNSQVFIDLAKKLFEKHKLMGEFYCQDIFQIDQLSYKFKQLLMLDVLEHIKRRHRKKFLSKIYNCTESGTIMLITIPHVKKRVSSFVNNKVRRSITQHIPFLTNKEEHPYPIPVKYEIIRMMQGFFTIDAIQETLTTDYYLLTRK